MWMVWGVECTAWSVEGKVCSVECRARKRDTYVYIYICICVCVMAYIYIYTRSALLAMRNNNGSLQSLTPATKHADDLLETKEKYCACHTKNRTSSRQVCRHMIMSRSATPVAQNRTTTCFNLMNQDSFCNFPHRHGEAKGKPETRDHTHWSMKTRIPRKPSSKFDNL